MSHDLSGYEEVPDRIVKFFEKYPEGSLRCEKVEYKELPAAHLGGKPGMHIIYHALAYRTPDDPKPGQGKASEPLPGLTPYTKGSELMNAETSAWGRALVALGFVGKKVASANEVRNRSAEREPGEKKGGTIKPSAPQKKTIQSLTAQKDVKVPQLAQMVGEITVTENVKIDEGWVDRYLTGGREGTASALIDRLMKGPIPEAAPTPPVPSSDLPAPGPDEFVHQGGPDDQFDPAQDAA